MTRYKETMLLLCGLWFGIVLQVQGQFGNQFSYQLILIDPRDPSIHHQGRVQIAINGIVGSVCSDYFRDEDARVICRQLEYTGGIAVLDGRFGQGTGEIWYARCNGNERYFWQCSYRVDDPNCDHTQDVGVICDIGDITSTFPPTVCPPSDIRLVGPSSSTGMGFVEVRRNGIWGAVCDDNWGTLNAQVVCRMLCYNPVNAQAGTALNINYAIGVVSRRFLADDVDCSGTETDIRQCRQANTGVHNCNPDLWEYASVTCQRYDHPRPRVPSPLLVCSNASMTMTALFQSSLDIERNITSIALSNAICNSVRMIDSTTTKGIRIPLNDCGTSKSVNRTHIFYTNTISVRYTSASNCSFAELCPNAFTIRLTCEFNRNLSISKNFTVITQSANFSSTADFEIEMSFFNDTFETELKPPFVIICGAWMWIDLKLKTTDADLKLIVPRCYATPHLDPDAEKCPLFNNKCEVDPTLTFHPLSPTRFGFAYATFKFINYTSVVIHCDAWVCVKSEKNSDCDRSCWSSSSRRSKRAVDTRATYRISSPPVTVDGGESDGVFGYRDNVKVYLGKVDHAAQNWFKTSGNEVDDKSNMLQHNNNSKSIQDRNKHLSSKNNTGNSTIQKNTKRNSSIKIRKKKRFSPTWLRKLRHYPSFLRRKLRRWLRKYRHRKRNNSKHLWKEAHQRSLKRKPLPRNVRKGENIQTDSKVVHDHE